MLLCITPFYLAICTDPQWSRIGLILFGLALLGQLWRCRRILESGTGTIAGATIAMWGVSVIGHQDSNRPNVPLAVVLVAVQITLTLIVESVKRWRRDAVKSLTPPPGDS